MNLTQHPPAPGSSSLVIVFLVSRKQTLGIRFAVATIDPKETLNYNKESLPVLAGIL